MSSREIDTSGNQYSQGAVDAGAVLRDARLRHGLSEDEVARSLRLSPKILEYIETGQFERLPGETFGRGYIRAYARLMNLDADPLVLEYDRQMGVKERAHAVHGIDKTDRYTAGRSNRMWLSRGALIIFLVIAGAVFLWWYENREAEQAAVSQLDERLFDEVLVDSLPSPVPLPGMRHAAGQDITVVEPLAPGLLQVAAVEAEAVAESRQAQDASVESAESAGEPAAVAGSTSQAEPAEAASDAASAGRAANGLHMRFNDTCWVQVSSAEGKALHTQLMQAEQSLDIDHEGPLQVVIGAIEAVSAIEYQGTRLDTAAYKPAGVVRLKLGQ
ncbi:helix-turn-helix domain-containing protein [Pseudomonas sp. gcc21]|uniref:RodZ domain-containing protein n=1 Tax=Pseudomonas sp. gcc21 TaxID=2726989 RepID=UPI001451F1C2|nr:RodZ domain-containing protein [Pseudomonas sp. gcc21]QJD59168.1 helix-turn-helix domain-containing protein [Pseudomonas sp. gcc21]